MDVELSFTDSPRQRLEAVIMQLSDLGALTPVAGNPQDQAVADLTGYAHAGYADDAVVALETTIEQIRAAVSARNRVRTDGDPQ